MTMPRGLKSSATKSRMPVASATASHPRWPRHCDSPRALSRATARMTPPNGRSTLVLEGVSQSTALRGSFGKS